MTVFVRWGPRGGAGDHRDRESYKRACTAHTNILEGLFSEMMFCRKMKPKLLDSHYIPVSIQTRITGLLQVADASKLKKPVSWKT
jgi:hypothetical protein